MANVISAPPEEALTRERTTSQAETVMPLRVGAMQSPLGHVRRGLLTFLRVPGMVTLREQIEAARQAQNWREFEAGPETIAQWAAGNNTLGDHTGAPGVCCLGALSAYRVSTSVLPTSGQFWRWKYCSGRVREWSEPLLPDQWQSELLAC